MNTSDLTQKRLKLPHTQSAFRRVNLLVFGYIGLSILTMLIAIWFRDDPEIVTPAVWIRGAIVVGSALLTAFFAARTAQGSRMGYIGLRLESAIMFVVMVVIVVLPGLFPLWMKIEQGVCGLFLLGIVVIASSKHVRQVFAPEEIKSVL